MFMYQYKMIKLFLEIFTRDKRIFRNMFNCFLTKFLTQTVADRPGRPTGRSTEPRASRPLRSTDVHSPVHVCQTQGRSADRIREPCSLYLGGRPSGQPEQEVCSLYPGGRPYCPNSHISDRWRSTG